MSNIERERWRERERERKRQTERCCWRDLLVSSRMKTTAAEMSTQSGGRISRRSDRNLMKLARRNEESLALYRL